jgi:hypothetical protein
VGGAYNPHAYKMLIGKPENLKRRAFLRDQGVDGRIILKKILNKWVVRMRIVFIWFWVGSNGGNF